MSALFLASIPILLIGAGLAAGLRSNAARGIAALATQALAALLVLASVVPILTGGPAIEVLWPWPAPIEQIAFRVDALGAFFLIVGVLLLVLRFAVPEAVARFDPLRLSLGAILALVLGAVNLMKWYSGHLWFRQQSTPVRRPLRPDPTDRPADEYNPEFDFGKSGETTGKPSRE